MGVVIRQKSVEYISNLISRGQVDLESSWSFEADDENRLIEEKGWETFMNVHLAYDDEGNEDAKDTDKFPVAKLKSDTVTVFRHGVIAAKQRAAQQGYGDVYDVASKLLDQIDEKYSEEKQAEKKEERTFEFPRVSYRDAEIQEVRSDDRFVVSVSSEAEVERFGYYEVLSHSRDAIVDDYLKNGMAVLVNHDRDKIIGISEGYEIRDGKLYVTYRLSKTAEPWKTLIEEGILRHTSIGYEILEYEQVGERDGLPVIQVTRWRPLEFSFVSIPADITVGVGRNKEVQMGENPEKIEEMKEEVKKMEKEEKERIIDVNKVEIKHETEKYSLVRVLQALAENRTLDGYEGEVHQEIERQVGKRAQGIYVPLDILARASDISGLKTTIHTGVVGEYPSVGTLENAGAKTLKGLQGSATVGIQGAYPNVTWGNTSATASDINIKPYELIPNTVQVKTSVYRSMLKQSVAGVEQYIRDMISTAISRGIEKAVIQGSGHQNSQPLGILNFNLGTGFAVGSGQTATTSWAYTDVVGAMGNVVGKVPNPVFLMNASLYATLKQIPRETGHPIYIIDQNNTIDGFKVLVHEHVPNNTLIFGDISTLLFAYWGAIDLIIDPYSAVPAVVLTAITEFDSAVIVPTAWYVLTLKSGS